MASGLPVWALPMRGARGRLQGWRRETGLALSCLFLSASCGLPVSVSSIPATILHRCRQCQTAAAAEPSWQSFQLWQEQFHTSLPPRRHCQQLSGSPAQRLGPRRRALPAQRSEFSALQGSSSVSRCSLCSSARGTNGGCFLQSLPLFHPLPCGYLVSNKHHTWQLLLVHCPCPCCRTDGCDTGSGYLLL